MDHVTRNALAAWNNEASGLGKIVSSSNKRPFKTKNNNAIFGLDVSKTIPNFWWISKSGINFNFPIIIKLKKKQRNFDNFCTEHVSSIE